MINFSDLTKKQNIVSKSISPENFTGEKGKGGMATEGTGANAARDLGQGWKISPSVAIEPNSTFVAADVKAMGAIKHMWMTDSAKNNRQLVLRIYWDGSETPSVEVPMCDFFASAEYQNYAQLTSLPVCVNPKRGFNCYWEMPFRTGFKVTVENLASEQIMLYYSIDYEEKEITEDALYFHAQFRRVNPLPYKQVYTILDGVKGAGQYVGTYLFWGLNNNRWWGEGEVKFYIDGDGEFPTICGTGTEDYFGGSWNFDIGGKYQEFCTPYTGVAKIIRPNGLYSANTRFSMYRWHLCDPVYFKEDLKVTIQALGWREGGRYLPLQDDISSVAFWYQDSISTTMPQLPDADGLEII